MYAIPSNTTQVDRATRLTCNATRQTYNWVLYEGILLPTYKSRELAFLGTVSRPGKHRIQLVF
jgi:hypothetical protein